MLIKNVNDLSPNVKVYNCFSPNLKQFLVLNGIFPIHQYKHENGKTVWIFIECKQLLEFLTVWTENNPKSKGGE